MIVKYCNKCAGKPYTTNVDIMSCPICSSTLRIESVDDFSLDERPMLPDICEDNQNGYKTQKHFEPTKTDEEKNLHLPIKDRKAKTEVVEQEKFSYKNGGFDQKNFEPDECIRGRVAQYSSTGKEDGEYRRLLPVKIYQAIVYRQRLEDVLHRFTVRVEQSEDALGYQNYTDIPVNVHGTIAGGLQIVDNAEVEVHGKYKNGVLMADSVYVINNGYESKVGFQHSVKAITYGILSAIMLAFICFVAASSNGNFIANIKEFCTVWFVIAAILTVLYLITSLTKIGLLTRMFSNKRRSFPLFSILLISLALAFLFVSAFGSFAGFGSYLSGWIYSLVPIIIIVVALFFIIKSMF